MAEFEAEGGGALRDGGGGCGNRGGARARTHELWSCVGRVRELTTVARRGAPHAVRAVTLAFAGENGDATT